MVFCTSISLTRSRNASAFADQAEASATRAETEANRATTEADRAVTEADRAESIANGLAGESGSDFSATYLEHFNGINGLPDDSNTDFVDTYENHKENDNIVTPTDPDNPGGTDPYGFVADFEAALHGITSTNP